MKKICEYSARIMAIIGCYFGIKASLEFVVVGILIALIEAIFGGQYLIYVVFINAILAILVSIMGAIISFGKNKRNASIFLVIFAIVGIFLAMPFFLKATYFFLLSALLLFISSKIEENQNIISTSFS